MTNAQQHIERLLKSRRGRIYSGETTYGVSILEYDEVEDRVKIKFDTTQRVDWYPRTWVYAAR